MNTVIQHRSHSISAAGKWHTPRFDEAQAAKRRALERWEGEGGKIPELFLVSASEIGPHDHLHGRQRA